MRTAWLTAGLVLVVLSGCALNRIAAPLPAGHSLVRDQLVIYSDFPLPRFHRLLDELAAQRSDLYAALDLPVTDEPIHVYLFETHGHYQAFIDQHYPELPTRRAFFVESDTRLSVYAHWGDRVAEDLRHEVCHGYLHAVLPNLPLWLDEGLAEYFEVPRGRRGLNQPHVATLLDALQRNEWQPDLRRLERLTSVSDMDQLDYAEAWAWTHMTMETTPELRQMLRDYLARLRTTGSAAPLSEVLVTTQGFPERRLLDHLHALGAR